MAHIIIEVADGGIIGIHSDDPNTRVTLIDYDWDDCAESDCADLITTHHPDEIDDLPERLIAKAEDQRASLYDE